MSKDISQRIEVSGKQELRSHFGSRAISVQVNIAAVSAHVFHSSLLVSCSLCLHIFASASCLNRPLLVHLAHRFPTHPCSSLLRILVLFRGSGSDLDGMGTRSRSTTDEKPQCLSFKFCTLRNADRANSCSHDLDVSYGFTYHEKHLDFATRLAEMEQNFSTLIARLCKVETHAASASNVSGSPGESWPSLEQVDGSTAAEFHGPGSSNGHRSTKRRLDIFPQALRMNIREVPSYYGSHANNTTKGLRSGSIVFGQNPTCQPRINLLRFTVRPRQMSRLCCSL